MGMGTGNAIKMLPKILLIAAKSLLRITFSVHFATYHDNKAMIAGSL